MRQHSKRNRKPMRGILLVAWLVLVACQPLDLSLDAPPEGGQLAYIGGDGNVYVIDNVAPYISGAADRSARALTEDATVSAEGNGRSYHRLAWSPDGQLAFAAVDRALGQTQSQLFVASPTARSTGARPRLLSENEQNFVIYMHWSPQPCTAEPACGRLSYLVAEEETIALRMVEFTRASVTETVIGRGAPFYFAWSPDGTRMLWHTNGARRFNEEARLTLYHLERDEAQILNRAPGLFRAPAWSPADGSWLDIVEDPGAAPESSSTVRRVEIAGAGVTIPPAAQASPLRARTVVTVPNDAAFAWSPDGTQIAYAARRNSNDPFLGPIHVVDVASGASRRVTDVGLHVTAFFWSPTGERLAYTNWLALPDEDWSQWRTIDLGTGEDRGFAAFNPSFHMRSLLGSFSQYAQSHRLWSPDGRYLVYADRAPDLTERIWLVDTLAPRGTPSIFVDEGAIAIWSWH